MKDYQGLSVFCDKGFQIPDGYVDAMLNAPSNIYGAVVRVASAKPALRIEHTERKIAKVIFDKINKTFEDSRIIHFLGQCPDGYLKDSLQPFRILVNSGTDTVLAATLVGDFAKFLPAESTQNSPHWWCANNKILPRMQQLWRLCKEDANAVNEELKTMEKEFTDLIGLQGGMITLVLATADDTVVHHFKKSIPTFSKFPWGTTSDVLGYVTGIKETKVVEQQPSMGIIPAEETQAVEQPAPATVTIGRRKTVAKASEDVQTRKDTPVVPNTTDTPKPTDDPKPVDDRTANKTAATTATSAKVVEKEVTLASGAIVRVIQIGDKKTLTWHPPMHLTKRRALRKAYLTAGGRSLSDEELKSRPGVILKNSALILEVSKSLQDLTVLAAPDSDAERFKPSPPETGTEVAEVQNKVTGQKSKLIVSDQPKSDPTSSPSDARTKEHPEGGSPIYSKMAPTQKHFVRKHLQALDKNGMSILNPVLVQELEYTTDQFYKDIDYPGLEQTLGWKFEERLALAKHAPEAMAVWAGDLIRMIYNLNKDIEQLTDPQTTTVGRKKAQAA